MTQLKDELKQAKERESKSLEAIQSLQESLQLADDAWKSTRTPNCTQFLNISSFTEKFVSLQKSGEQIIVEQAEKYEKLIAALEEQLKATKRLIQEQFDKEEELAEQSSHSDAVWMCMLWPVCWS